MVQSIWLSGWQGGRTAGFHTAKSTVPQGKIPTTNQSHGLASQGSSDRYASSVCNAAKVGAWVLSTCLLTRPGLAGATESQGINYGTEFVILSGKVGTSSYYWSVLTSKESKHPHICKWLSQLLSCGKFLKLVVPSSPGFRLF